MSNKKYVIQLSEKERAELEGLVRTGQRAARVMRRAQLLMWSDEGKSDETIASLLKVSSWTVSMTRKRWVEERSLEDAPRKGRKPKTDGKQDAFLVALACSAAPDGQEHWTMQMLADQLVTLGVIDEPISDETVRRRLKKMNSSRG